LETGLGKSEDVMDWMKALWLWALCEKLCISFAVIFYREER
jgi:hypothetical protein